MHAMALHPLTHTLQGFLLLQQGLRATLEWCLWCRVNSLKDDARTDAMLHVLRKLPELERHSPAILAELGQVCQPECLQQMAFCALLCCCEACSQVSPTTHVDTWLCALQIAFVPTASGDLMPPNQLYSPRDSELMALLNPQTSFPIGQEAHLTMQPTAARLLPIAVMLSCVLPQMLAAAMPIRGVAVPGVPPGFSRPSCASWLHQ